MAALLDRIDQQQDRIGRFRAFPGGVDHRAVEAALGREDTGRIDEDHLCLVVQGNAHHPRTRCLRLGAGDCDLLPHKLVHEGGFARIGGADHGDDAAAGLAGLAHAYFSMNAFAAAFSASPLLPAVASASPTLCTFTRTVNLAA